MGNETLNQRLEKLIEDNKEDLTRLVYKPCEQQLFARHAVTAIPVEVLQPLIKELEQYGAKVKQLEDERKAIILELKEIWNCPFDTGNKHHYTATEAAQFFQGVALGLSDLLDRDLLAKEFIDKHDAKVKAEAIRDAIAEYIASHEAPDGCYQMAWFHGYADALNQEDNSNV